jgi:hypothetical protein
MFAPATHLLAAGRVSMAAIKLKVEIQPGKFRKDEVHSALDIASYARRLLWLLSFHRTHCPLYQTIDCVVQAQRKLRSADAAPVWKWIT